MKGEGGILLARDPEKKNIQTASLVQTKGGNIINSHSLIMVKAH